MEKATACDECSQRDRQTDPFSLYNQSVTQPYTNPPSLRACLPACLNLLVSPLPAPEATGQPQLLDAAHHTGQKLLVVTNAVNEPLVVHTGLQLSQVGISLQVIDLLNFPAQVALFLAQTCDPGLEVLGRLLASLPHPLTAAAPIAVLTAGRSVHAGRAVYRFLNFTLVVRIATATCRTAVAAAPARTRTQLAPLPGGRRIAVVGSEGVDVGCGLWFSVGAGALVPLHLSIIPGHVKVVVLAVLELVLHLPIRRAPVFVVPP
mmetsp:Transcript_7711/g.18932  ORF Transcript_7711/g.18932 Transcript_7711/m.18932 type:complete len:262 (-) Transcript_7711:242-1027(-)